MKWSDCLDWMPGIVSNRCRGLVLAVCTIVCLSNAGPSHAQVLNQQLVNMLANNCANLGGVGGSYGPNLNPICQGAAGVPSGAGGGGAASVQTAAVSILNRSILQRLEEERAESGQTGAAASAMLANPFGVLMPGLFGTPGVATSGSPQSGTGSAVFNTASSSRWHGIGFFASGLVEALDRKIGAFQDGYKSSIHGFTVGADYRMSKQSTVGLAFSYANTDGDFRSGGNFSTNAYTVTVFGSYYPTDRTFAQVNGAITINNFKVTRATNLDFVAGGAGGPIVGNSSSTSNGNMFRLGALTGYDHPIGMFTVGPRAGFNYSRTHVAGYEEQGNTGLELAYDSQYVESFQSVLGVQGSAAFSTPAGVFVPQVNADYIHEFENSQRFIVAHFVEDLKSSPTRFTFQNDVPVRNYFNLGTGLIAVLPGGFQPFINFRAMVGNNQFHNYAGTFGLRVEL